MTIDTTKLRALIAVANRLATCYSVGVCGEEGVSPQQVKRIAEGYIALIEENDQLRRENAELKAQGEKP